MFQKVVPFLHYDLQVNNGDVDLDRPGVDGDPVCYTAANPFHVRLLNHDKRREQTQFRLSKRRVRSPARKPCRKGNNEKFGTEESPSIDTSKVHRSMELPSQPSCKFSVKVGEIGGLRCTPDRKKRRRSRLVEP